MISDECSRLGFPKRAENFIFFAIEDATRFKNAIGDLARLITSTEDVKQARSVIHEFKINSLDKSKLVKFIGINVAFTSQGLKKVCDPFRVLYYLSNLNMDGFSWA